MKINILFFLLSMIAAPFNALARSNLYGEMEAFTMTPTKNLGIILKQITVSTPGNDGYPCNSNGQTYPFIAVRNESFHMSSPISCTPDNNLRDQLQNDMKRRFPLNVTTDTGVYVGDAPLNGKMVCVGYAPNSSPSWASGTLSHLCVQWEVHGGGGTSPSCQINQSLKFSHAVNSNEINGDKKTLALPINCTGKIDAKITAGGSTASQSGIISVGNNSGITSAISIFGEVASSPGVSVTLSQGTTNLKVSSTLKTDGGKVKGGIYTGQGILVLSIQ